MLAAKIMDTVLNSVSTAKDKRDICYLNCSVICGESDAEPLITNSYKRRHCSKSHAMVWSVSHPLPSVCLQRARSPFQLLLQEW